MLVGKNYNKMLKDISFIIIIYLICSCNTAPLEEISIIDSGEKLVFSTEISSTKGASLYESNIIDFGVYAFYSENGVFDANISKPDFFYNQMVSRDQEQMVWSYEPVKFWPLGEQNKVSFFAYAPYVPAGNENGITLSGESEIGVPSLTYVVPTDVSKQPDLLIANALYNRNGGGVAFSFEHALARISFEVGGKGHSVKSVVVTGVSTQGDLDMELPVEWTNLNTPQNVDFSAGLAIEDASDHVFIASDEPHNILANDGYLMMLPQILTENSKLRIVYDDDQLVELSLNNNSWEAGKNYVYRIHISYEGVEIKPNCYIVKPNNSVTIPFNNLNIFWGRGGDGAIAKYIQDNGGLGDVVPEAAFSYVATDHQVNTTDYIAELIWTDTSDETLSFVKYSDSLDVSGMSEEGNYIIGVRKIGVNSENEYLWSWHLWVTDYDPEVNNIPLVSAEGKSYTIMDRNLGAKGTSDFLDAVGLYYQWGRKDPFPRPKEYKYGVGSMGMPNKLMDIRGKITALEVQTGEYSSLLECVHKPYLFYSTMGPIHTGYLSNETGNTRWGSDRYLDKLPKSLYDPSPEGWRIPWDENMLPDPSMVSSNYVERPNHIILNTHMYPFTGRLVSDGVSYPDAYLGYWARLHLGSPAQDADGICNSGHGLIIDNDEDNNDALIIGGVITQRVEALNIRCVRDD